MATSRHCSITCRVPSERSCIPFQSNQKRSDRVGLQIWVPVFCIVANMCNHNLSLPRDPQDHCMVAATRSDFYTMSNLADLNNPLTRSFNHVTALPWTCESMNLSARDDCEHSSAITIAACGRCAGIKPHAGRCMGEAWFLYVAADTLRRWKLDAFNMFARGLHEWWFWQQIFLSRDSKSLQGQLYKRCTCPNIYVSFKYLQHWGPISLQTFKPAVIDHGKRTVAGSPVGLLK